MGWWEDLGNAVSEAVDAVADVVQAVVETAADAAADVVETAGNAVQGWLAQFGGAMEWLGGVISGTANVVGAAIKFVSGIVSGVVGGLIRIVGGLLCWNGALIFKGVLDILAGIAGGFIYSWGTLFALIEKILSSPWVKKALSLRGINLPVERKERGLTKAEQDMLERIFSKSISLYNIRIVEGPTPIFGGGRYATTLGNTIYMREINPDTDGGRSTLVHETLHVWQYQNLGSRYTADALGAQFLLPHNDDVKIAYNWEVSEVNRGNTDWKDFNREGQAEFIQDLWRLGTLTFNGNTRQGKGAFFDLQDVQSSFDNGTAEFTYTGSVDSAHATVANSDIPIDYTDIATEAVKSIRERINLRLSQRL
jgi:hypothetical protein